MKLSPSVDSSSKKKNINKFAIIIVNYLLSYSHCVDINLTIQTQLFTPMSIGRQVEEQIIENIRVDDSKNKDFNQLLEEYSGYLLNYNEIHKEHMGQINMNFLSKMFDFILMDDPAEEPQDNYDGLAEAYKDIVNHSIHCFRKRQYIELLFPIVMRLREINKLESMLDQEENRTSDQEEIERELAVSAEEMKTIYEQINEDQGEFLIAIDESKKDGGCKYYYKQFNDIIYEKHWLIERYGFSSSRFDDEIKEQYKFENLSGTIVDAEIKFLDLNQKILLNVRGKQNEEPNSENENALAKELLSFNAEINNSMESLHDLIDESKKKFEELKIKEEKEKAKEEKERKANLKAQKRTLKYWFLSFCCGMTDAEILALG